MKSLKSALQLNVLIQMAVANSEFKQLLMRDPLLAVQEYNCQMLVDHNPACNLPRLEVEMLQRASGVTSDFKRFCQILSDERERIERMDEQRQWLEVLVPSGVNSYQPYDRLRSA